MGLIFFLTDVVASFPGASIADLVLPVLITEDPHSRRGCGDNSVLPCDRPVSNFFSHPRLCRPSGERCAVKIGSHALGAGRSVRRRATQEPPTDCCIVLGPGRAEHVKGPRARMFTSSLLQPADRPSQPPSTLQPPFSNPDRRGPSVPSSPCDLKALFASTFIDGFTKFTRDVIFQSASRLRCA